MLLWSWFISKIYFFLLIKSFSPHITPTIIQQYIDYKHQFGPVLYHSESVSFSNFNSISSKRSHSFLAATWRKIVSRHKTRGTRAGYPAHSWCCVISARGLLGDVEGDMKGNCKIPSVGKNKRKSYVSLWSFIFPTFQHWSTALKK